MAAGNTRTSGEALAPGPRDHLITRALRAALDNLDPELIDEEALDPAEAPTRLARHLAAELERALRAEDDASTQARYANDVLRGLTNGSAERIPVNNPPTSAGCSLAGISRSTPVRDG